MPTLSKRRAQALWNQLHEQFANVQETISEIISTRAWESLGFDTFTEAWKANMDGVPIASFIAPALIYQMLDEGQSEDDIIESVVGLGENQVKNLARQKKAGVPVDKAKARASLTPAQRKAAKSSTSKRVSVELDPETYQELKAIATEYGQTVEECVAEAVDEYLDRYGLSESA
jgi:hypothetical protein